MLLLLRHIIMKAMATCLPKNESGLVAKSRLPASLSTWRTSTKAVEEARWMTAGFRTPIRSAVAESLKTLQPRLGSHRSSSVRLRCRVGAMSDLRGNRLRAYGPIGPRGVV